MTQYSIVQCKVLRDCLCAAKNESVCAETFAQYYKLIRVHDCDDVTSI